jgi:hypothetical protein
VADDFIDGSRSGIPGIRNGREERNCLIGNGAENLLQAGTRAS